MTEYPQNWRNWRRQAEELACDKKWNFNKFKIKCAKCGSLKVEMNGEAESVGGYYGDHELDFLMIVKCHDCGSAMIIKNEGWKTDEIKFGNNNVGRGTTDGSDEL